MKKKNDILIFLKSFVDLLEKNNLWYVAEFGTLLGAIREGKMIEWDDDIDLCISIDTYNYLKKNYPKNFLDLDTKGYPFIFAKWVPDIDNYLNSNIFIDLFVAIPTNIEKMNKYKKFSNVYRYANQMFNKGSKYKGWNWKLKLLKIALWPIQWTSKKLELKEIVNILEEKENPEFVQIINAPNSNLIGERRTLNVWNRKKIKFEYFELYVSLEHDLALKSTYGDNYMTPIKEINSFKHISAINIEKRNNDTV